MRLSQRRPGDRRQFDDLPRWNFWIHEYAPGGWRVTAVREGGVTGEGAGSDPDSLLDDYRAWALQVDRDLEARTTRSD